MHLFRLPLVFAGALALASVPCLVRAADAEADSRPKLNILKGPTKAPLGKIARIELPTGYMFIDGKSYRELLKAEGEPVSGQELGLLRATNQQWSLVFEFSDIGYVKDDEKDKLNADKLLEQIKRGTEEANKQRARAGNPPIKVIGWDMPPKYDETSHNLEWAIRGEVEGQPILNYSTRMLGRKGVMKIVLICEPDQLASTLPTFRDLLAGYTYQTGQTYAEYRPGDKIAKYGLGALVVGGAAVGAAKLGAFAWLAVLFKKGFKLIIIAVITVAAFFRKLFGKLTGRGDSGTGT